MAPPLKMYSELAKWWPLLSPPGHYVKEAQDLRAMLQAAFDAAAAAEWLKQANGQS